MGCRVYTHATKPVPLPLCMVVLLDSVAQVVLQNVMNLLPGMYKQIQTTSFSDWKIHLSNWKFDKLL